MTAGKVKQLPKSMLTDPSVWRQRIVCTDNCEECPLFQKGCAGKCTRFPTAVCATCPCRASQFTGKINER